MAVLVITLVVLLKNTSLNQRSEITYSSHKNECRDGPCLCNLAIKTYRIAKNKKPYKLIEDSIFIFLNMSTDIFPYVVKISFKLSFDFVRIEYK
jgi:hypothetical protein